MRVSSGQLAQVLQTPHLSPFALAKRRGEQAGFISLFLEADNQSGTGSKPANISEDSDNVLSGIQSQTSKNRFHITRTFGFLCAASIASCDFHSETSIIVPSRARMMIGARSVTSPSLRNVGTRLLTRPRVSLSFPGLGRYATMTMIGSIIAESQHILIRDNNNHLPGQVRPVAVEYVRVAHCI
jgi:hypothetical protein